MSGIRDVIANFKYRFFELTYVPFLVTLTCVAIGAILVERENNFAHQRVQTAQVRLDLERVHARLEKNLSNKLQAMRDIVQAVSLTPEISDERLQLLAATFFADEIGEVVIGTTRKIDDPIIRVVDNAGIKLIIQMPVTIVSRTHYPILWGSLSARFDFDALIEDIGVNASSPLEIALFKNLLSEAAPRLFYGRQELSNNSPLQDIIFLPVGSWTILAIPRGGWRSHAPHTWLIRSISFLLAALVCVLFLKAQKLSKHHLLQQQELEVVSRRLNIALKVSEIGVWEYDSQSGKLFWDERLREIYGLPLDKEVIYEDWVQRIHHDDLKNTETELNRALADKGPFNCQFRVISSKGIERHIRSMGSAEVTSDGVLCIIGVNWDVSEDVQRNTELRRANLQSEARNAELEEAKSKVEEMALHDVLTALPNRRYLDKTLGELFDKPGQDLVLLHIDLDRFKEINDTLGHAAGDAMLCYAADVLRKVTRKNDFVARIGGDEFVVICSDGRRASNARTLAQRLIAAINVPFDFEGQSCGCGVSIGIAVSDASLENSDQLFVNADIALYRAKNEGRNRFCFYTPELRHAITRQKSLSDEIVRGFENGEFVTYYQGQFDAATHALTGAESLIRWNHPTKGILPPSAFLEMAEQLNMLSSIDALVLEQSLKQMRRWHRAGLVVPQVSVNVSSKRLSDPELGERIKNLKFKPGTLTFELVESTFLDQQSDQVAWNIDQIREAGIEIEIDDFGTGHASIVGLTHLRPKRLKIDQQLILPITESKAQRQLVCSIVQIGHSLGIESIAEGVETIEHAQILHELGCEGLQGYAFAKPLSARDFGAFVRAWRPEVAPGRLIA